jgi:predicted kinase
MATGKLIITRGLPGSGKSTWALYYATRSENYDTTRIVTMDDIRAAIDARFAAGDEYIVQSIRDFTIRAYLKRGYTVISADTNLNEHTFNQVKRQAALASEDLDLEFDLPVEIKDFTDVDLGTCLRRNQDRWFRGDHKVPDQAIIDMWQKYIKK